MQLLPLFVVGVHSLKKHFFYCFLFQGAESGELINEVTIFTRVCKDAEFEATKRFNFSPVPLIFISCLELLTFKTRYTVGRNHKINEKK